MKKEMIGLMAGLFLVGCSTPQSCILVENTTGIGLVVKENPKTQMYEFWMSYINSVFGLVPTNRGWNKDVPAYGDGAKDTGNVIFETNFSNWFCFWNSQGIYQRVAIGDDAVKQPGAVAMFARNSSGNISNETIQALTNLSSYSNNRTLLDVKNQLADLCKSDVNNKTLAVNELKKSNMTWDQFMDNSTISVSYVNTIINLIKSQNMTVKVDTSTSVDSGNKNATQGIK
jgi:hypothetical protein